MQIYFIYDDIGRYMEWVRAWSALPSKIDPISQLYITNQTHERLQ